jgi:hypothetical protein
MKFTVLATNMRSLTNDDRIELDLITWDAVLIIETWCASEWESWLMESGHLFAAAGCTDASRGVAILLHRRWTGCVGSFEAVNERVCYMILNYVFDQRVLPP